MSEEVNNKYHENKASLRRRIRNGELPVYEGEPVDNACYFCGERIKGRMHILIDSESNNGIESETRYTLDDLCYWQALFLDFHQ
jgi:hypothetical protein